MRIFPYITILFILAGCKTVAGKSKPSSAGGEYGNGTGRPMLAWFVDRSRTVQYCVETSPDFGIDRTTILQSVDQAINTWTSFIKSRAIHTIYDQDDAFRPDLYRGRNSLALKYAYQDSCEKSDLRFFIGVNDKPEIQTAKGNFFEPISFAERTDEDFRENVKAGWGNGFVWLAPSSEMPDPKYWTNQPKRLIGMLIHEMGHVYGVPHLDGTIMMSEIYAFLLNEKNQSRWDQIEHSRLIFFGQTKMTLQSEPLNQTPELRRLFSALVGRQPQGTIRSSFLHDPTKGREFLKDYVVLSNLKKYLFGEKVPPESLYDDFITLTDEKGTAKISYDLYFKDSGVIQNAMSAVWYFDGEYIQQAFNRSDFFWVQNLAADGIRYGSLSPQPTPSRTIEANLEINVSNQFPLRIVVPDGETEKLTEIFRVSDLVKYNGVLQTP
ncbi:MAG: hypothetical protein AB7T49_15590 [Oligoflexales bacterium]